MTYQPGDTANGYVLGEDNQWHPLPPEAPAPPPPAQPTTALPQAYAAGPAAQPYQPYQPYQPAQPYEAAQPYQPVPPVQTQAYPPAQPQPYPPYQGSATPPGPRRSRPFYKAWWFWLIVVFVMIGLVSAVGTALVYGFGGLLVIQDKFTVGTIVAFGSYLSTLYGALQGLAGAPVEFSTSMVSFERVFEIIDLPHDIEEKKDAHVLKDAKGELAFEDISFKYSINENIMLSEVKRYGLSLIHI